MEFRDKLVAIARTGRSFGSLARDYESCAAAKHDWVKQAGADAGENEERLTGSDLEELCQFRREVK